VAAGLALVIAWILQPILDFLAAALPLRLKAQVQAMSQTAGRRWPEAPVPLAAAPVAECVLPEPTARRLSVVEAEAQRRRCRARLKAELCFPLHEPLVADRFSRAMFEDFMQRYLGDQHGPDDVEEFSRELEIIIRQHAGAAQTGETPLGL